MPLYEYRCESCNHQFEVIQKFSDEPISVCPQCGNGPVGKLLSSPAFQFKGSGWYITDYARKEQAKPKDKSSESSAPASDSASKSSTTSTPPSAPNKDS